MADPSCTLTIGGRDYRFKAGPEQAVMLQQITAELEVRLQQQTQLHPLATRDQLLMLTAVNLTAELLQQHSAMLQLLQEIEPASS